MPKTDKHGKSREFKSFDFALEACGNLMTGDAG